MSVQNVRMKMTERVVRHRTNPCPKCGETVIHKECPTILERLTYVAERGYGQKLDVEKALELMRLDGSFVTLNGADKTGWECTWYTGEERFSSEREVSISHAIYGVIALAWHRLTGGELV
jgi:hypothetical protein